MRALVLLVLCVACGKREEPVSPAPSTPTVASTASDARVEESPSVVDAAAAPPSASARTPVVDAAASVDAAPSSSVDAAVSPSGLRDPVLRGAKWMDVFAIYPTARKLCDEHVTGNSMHIRWESYATHDDPGVAVSFYERMHPSLVRPPTGTAKLTLKAGNDKTLEVHPATATGIPSCSTKPDAKDRAVIVVSQAIR